MRNISSRALRASVSLAGMTLFGMAALGLATASPLGGLGGNGADHGSGSGGSPMLGGGSDPGVHNGLGDVEMPSIKYSAYSAPLHKHDDDTCFGLGGTYTAPMHNVFQANCQQKHNSYFKGNANGHHFDGGKQFEDYDR
jgi:hypothetical protein